MLQLLAGLVLIEGALLQVATQGCSTRVTTQYGIDSTIADYSSFESSMNARFSTPGVPWSGTRINVITTILTFTQPTTTGSFEAVYQYDSNALRSAGYNIVSAVTTITSCVSTTTTLPPSPTGAICSPHGDHWHCEPLPTSTPATTTSTQAEQTCIPHDDHWHCPPGVAPPTTAPEPSRTTSSISTTSTISTSTTSPGNQQTCAPHDDHWHCPPGVSAPATPTGTPSIMTTSTGTRGGGSGDGPGSSTTATTSGPRTVATAGANVVGSSAQGALAVGALFLAWFC